MAGVGGVRVRVGVGKEAPTSVIPMFTKGNLPLIVSATLGDRACAAGSSSRRPP